ncbi:MAG: cytidine deaminase [Cyanobacteria bacterium SZAS LIN-2]|nr:cytidine deaminase [Cyanobacteria bacterium SZAS LIN-2]
MPPYTALVQAARQAAKNAYAPYTNKGQGAAVLTESGEIFCGVTVEIASYVGSTTAEINAVTQAIAHGHRKFKAIAIEPYTHPSGMARQFIAEFGIDCDLVKGTDNSVDADVEVFPLKDLLPMHFGPENIEAEKRNRDATSGSAV